LFDKTNEKIREGMIFRVVILFCFTKELYNSNSIEIPYINGLNLYFYDN